MTEYTIDQIEWREGELNDVIEFLSITNPKGYSANDIKAHAFRAWKEGNYKPTFVGTAGWYVTIVQKSWNDPAKPFIALVSIMAYSAALYMREQRELDGGY